MSLMSDALRDQAGRPARPVRVLVVDDDEQTRVGVALYLREFVDAEVDVVGGADSGPEAIDRVRALHPDLVIMDARMPGMSGFAATRAIRGERPETRVAILSLFDDEFARADAERAGAVGFVAKTDLAELGPIVGAARDALGD